MTGFGPLDALLIAVGLIVAGLSLGFGLGAGTVVAEWALFGRRGGMEDL